MSDKIEIQGKTVEAAVSEALLRLGARRDEVEIKVLEEPKAGFMGFLGGRAAKVLVRKKASRNGGGRSRDFRVDDENHQAHNLSGGRGRSPRRRPDGDSGGSGASTGSPDRKKETQEAGREERSRNRRGSRGRGGRGRNQEAAERTPSQDRQPERTEQPVRAGKEERSGGRPAGGRSRNERGRRSAPGGTDARPDNRPETRPETRPDIRPDSRPERQERDRAASRPEERPSTPVEAGRNQRREAPAPVPTSNITPPETKVETSVAIPKKPKKGFGGLGARLKERKAVERQTLRAASAPAAPPAAAAAVRDFAPAVRPSAAPDSAPARDYSHESRNQERRVPVRQSPDYADEAILRDIKGMDYAKAVGTVTEEGLDAALTELTDGLLARAGFPCECETHPGEYRQIQVTTDDASAGMLIGRHGQTIDAVEHLVERMASNAIDARARINLDINDYRQRREEGLAERVKEAAASIRETGKSVHLEPMSARERRLVHMEAAGIEGLRTFTMDRAGSKHVVLAPDTEGSGQGEAEDDRADDSDQGNNY